MAKGISGSSSFRYTDSNFYGPFGQFSTSSYSKTHVLQTSSAGTVSQTKSFTISAFVNPTGATGVTGIFSLTDKSDYSVLFAGIDKDKYSKIRIENSVNGQILTYLNIRSDSWNYFAITFNSLTCELAIYNQYGMVYRPKVQFELCTIASTINYVLGAYTGCTNCHYTAHVSCLMLHSAVLSESEIAQSYQACRSVHGTAPCGAPKLPITPIPNPAATNPSNGQFPFIANIKLSPISISCSSLCWFHSRSSVHSNSCKLL